jgi:hypothetical protein
MNDIPKIPPIPQAEIDALAESVGICERIALEFKDPPVRLTRCCGQRVCLCDRDQFGGSY